MMKTTNAHDGAAQGLSAFAEFHAATETAAQDAASGTERSLVELPPELLERIGSHLGAKDLVALTRTGSRHIAASFAYQLNQARTLDAVRKACERSTDLAVLTSSIQGLRPAHQVDALQQWATRLRELPAVRRSDRVADFYAVVASLPHIADQPPLALKLRLACHDSAWSAVEAGESEEAVAAAFQLSSPREMKRLAWTVAHKEASALVGAGASVADTATAFDLDRRGYDYLAHRSVDGPAGAAVLAGQRVQEVYQSGSFFSNKRRGYQFHFSEGAIRRLDQMVFDGPASQAVLAGERVVDVFLRHGFSNVSYHFRLQELACHGPAGAAVKAGEDVDAVATRYGINAPSYLRRWAQESGESS